MRLFLYTYDKIQNFENSRRLGVFGARAGGKGGLETKVRQLRRGDLIVIRTTEGTAGGRVSILGCCRVVGNVFDQRDGDGSSYREQVWQDEAQVGAEVRYDLRVPVDFEIPQPEPKLFRWRELAQLGIRNRKEGRLLANGNAWGAFFKGNFIEDPVDVAAVCGLLGIAGSA